VLKKSSTPLFEGSLLVVMQQSLSDLSSLLVTNLLAVPQGKYL
jgi:hypothetical protein